MLSPQVHIRWLIPRDLAEVAAIEAASFETPWGEEHFRDWLRSRNVIGMAADAGVLTQAFAKTVVAGYVVYELHRSKLQILNLAVDPGRRRRGIGRRLIDHLKHKLSAHRRSRVVAEVHERSLEAQLFFRAQGFRATSVLRGLFESTGEDGYLMQFSLNAGAFQAAEEE